MQLPTEFGLLVFGFSRIFGACDFLVCRQKNPIFRQKKSIFLKKTHFSRKTSDYGPYLERFSAKRSAGRRRRIARVPTRVPPVSVRMENEPTLVEGSSPSALKSQARG